MFSSHATVGDRIFVTDTDNQGKPDFFPWRSPNHNDPTSHNAFRILDKSMRLCNKPRISIYFNMLKGTLQRWGLLLIKIQAKLEILKLDKLSNCIFYKHHFVEPESSADGLCSSVAWLSYRVIADNDDNSTRRF